MFDSQKFRAMKSWDGQVWRRAVKVKIYKVMMPSCFAWPPGFVILKVCSVHEEADKYIAAYPNILLRPLMTVQAEEVTYHDETD